MAARSLRFEPADSIVFELPDGVNGADGGAAEGVLHVTNVSPPPTNGSAAGDGGAYVVLKVKTNAAERFLVQPHIALLRPGETKAITIKVPPAQVGAFKADVAKQSAASPGPGGKRPTAFLMLAWPMAPPVGRALLETLEAQPTDKARAAHLNTVWRTQEAADRDAGLPAPGSGSKAGAASSFEATKFTVRCSPEEEARLRRDVLGIPLPPPPPAAATAAAAANVAGNHNETTAFAATAQMYDDEPSGAPAGAVGVPTPVHTRPAAAVGGGAAAVSSSWDDPASVAAAGVGGGTSGSVDAAALAAALAEARAVRERLAADKEALQRMNARKERDVESLRVKLAQAQADLAAATAAAAAAAATPSGRVAQGDTPGGLRRRRGGGGGDGIDDAGDDADGAGADRGPLRFAPWQVLLLVLIAVLVGRISAKW